MIHFFWAIVNNIKIQSKVENVDYLLEFILLELNLSKLRPK